MKTFSFCCNYGWKLKLIVLAGLELESSTVRLDFQNSFYSCFSLDLNLKGLLHDRDSNLFSGKVRE